MKTKTYREALIEAEAHMIDLLELAELIPDVLTAIDVERIKDFLDHIRVMERHREAAEKEAGK